MYPSEEGLDGNEGLIYTKRVGEVPIIQMATFSLWKDFESVKQFAYKTNSIRKPSKNTNMNGIQKSCFQDFNLINQVVLGKRPFGDLKQVIVELRLLS
jgi:hypothetical protein